LTPTFWSAAQIAGCRYLLSEDLQTGQGFDGLTVISPFVTEVSQIFPAKPSG